MKARGAWRTRYGFYMAAIGSSFGLGNLWRFPYVVGSNGGGAFVLLYIFLSMLIGLSLLIAEFALGKITRQSAVGSIESAVNPNQRLPRVASSGLSGWTKLNWLWFGRLAIFASLTLLSYYAVISGWVLFFLAQFTAHIFQSDPIRPMRLFNSLMANGALQMGLATIHTVLAGYVVARGVQEGIEKWIGTIMSVFVVLVVFLAYQSLSLPGTAEALRFLFYPDFSEFKATTLIHVLGHIFFTLSIGMGAMVTFGSYLREEIHTPTEGFRVTALDTFISLFAGFLIFPIVFSGGIDTEAGPGLLFQSIPVLFEKTGLGTFFGMAFFLCLYCAALGATIGLLEAGVANLVDRKKYSRETSSLIMGSVVLLFSLFPALGSSVFKNWTYKGMNLLQIFDTVIITWILPLTALGISLIVGYKLDNKRKKAEFLGAEGPATERLYSNWCFVLKWVTPILIVGALILNVVGLVMA